MPASPAFSYPNRRGSCVPLRRLLHQRRKHTIALSILLLLLFVFVWWVQDNGPPYEPFYHPFNLPPAHAAIADSRVRAIAAQAAVSDECVEEWIARGVWGARCSKVVESRIDLVYTWVNGSDPLHHAARKNAIAHTIFPPRAGSKLVNAKPKEARFREHDELRYSLRSIRAATASWKHTAVHLVTADVHPEDPENPNPNPNRDARLGLVPQWLDMRFVGLPRREKGPPAVYLHHDSELFRLTGNPGAAEVYAWRNKTLPTFNSHAIESQLPNLDPELVAENIITLNDDNFLLRALPPSAFHSPLYGPVFLFQTNRLVESDATGTLDGASELRSLAWSNHLLDERFGARPRAYIMHNARALSLPLLHEASLAFAPHFSATPLSRFRGLVGMPPDIEVNMMFLASHFVVERHREALLYAWVVAKWGSSKPNHGEEAGMLTPADKDAMWAELARGSVEAEEIALFGKATEPAESHKEGENLRVLWPRRAARVEVARNMHRAGIREPFKQGNASQPHAQYAFVSADGYPHAYLPLAPDTPVTRHATPDFAVLSNNIACEVRRAECLGPNVGEPAWDVFRRVLIENRACGDCFIAALMRAVGERGLEIFLPAPSTTDTSPPTTEPPMDAPLTLPLILPLKAPPLPADPRKFALRLIYRYSYALGVSTTKFIMLTGTYQGRLELKRVDANPDIALLCINDDLPEYHSATVSAADKLLREWFEGRWPEKMECEL